MEQKPISNLSQKRDIINSAQLIVAALGSLDMMPNDNTVAALRIAAWMVNESKCILTEDVVLNMTVRQLNEMIIKTSKSIKERALDEIDFILADLK